MTVYNIIVFRELYGTGIKRDIFFGKQNLPSGDYTRTGTNGIIRYYVITSKFKNRIFNNKYLANVNYSVFFKVVS